MPPAAWDNALMSLCGGDLALEAHVRAMLEADAAASTGDPVVSELLSPPASSTAPGPAPSSTRPTWSRQLPSSSSGNTWMEGAEAGDVEARPQRALPERYEELGVLGKGGMAMVYRVRDRYLRRELALKVLHLWLKGHPQIAKRFVEEAQLTAQLQHPGVVPLYDAGITPDGRPFFTMQINRGRTLGEVIAAVHEVSGGGGGMRTEDGWSLRRLVETHTRVCEAVAYAHELGVAHRDLKPDNILLGEHGEVLVADWGIAKVVELSQRSQVVETLRTDGGSLGTLPGQVSGTPAYMSPEQARGEVDRVGLPTDVYALGAVLFEILCGQPPYGEGKPIQVLQRVLEGPPEWPQGGRPPELEAIARRAMSRSPADRPGSASEIAEALAAWLDGAPTPSMFPSS